MRKRCSVAIVLLLLCGGVAVAQKPYWELELGGSCMIHHIEDAALMTSGTADANVSWYSLPHLRADGSSATFSYGFRASFSYIPQGIAGHRFGMAGLVRGPLLSRLDYHMGFGLSAFTKPWSITHDTLNDYIGSVLNCLIDIGLDYRIGQNVSLSMAFTHSSNGLLYKPNKGLNFFHAGLSYRFGADEPSFARSESVRSAVPYRHEVGFTLSPGVAMSRKWWQDGYFFCYDVSLNYLYHLNTISAVGATADFWYNYAHPAQFRWLGLECTVPVYFGMMPVYEGVWGPLSLRMGMGPILVYSQMVTIHWYERVGVYYNAGQHYFGVGINAHRAAIEFVEWSYGYRIPLGK